MDPTSVGIVAIGRNEGARLRACLESLTSRHLPILFVDSGSTDGSPAHAKALGIPVHELAASRPVSAARARNEGLERLLDLHPGLSFVQFVDGDCTLVEGWIERAAGELTRSADVAAVSGRLREADPGASVYNRLCDMEWDGPVGEVVHCGGIALYRVKAFQEARGFNPEVIAGEEPELCYRLRRAGWRILRLADDMALHDAAMTRFGQWWRRAVRSGYGHAMVAGMRASGEERHRRREQRSVLFWGLALPVAALVLAWPTRGLSIGLLVLGYAALFWRVRRAQRRRGRSGRDAALYARFVVIGKLAEAGGLLRYRLDRLLGRRSRIIEHRTPGRDPVREQD